MAVDVKMEDAVLPQRRKLKTSDLPLSSAQRSSIDSLLHTIKKKGEFDNLRKRVWSQYAESVSHAIRPLNSKHSLICSIHRMPKQLSQRP